MMKASRFVKAFEVEVDRWERTLSHILEVIEMLLTVQRQWMYLEASRVSELGGPPQGCFAVLRRWIALCRVYGREWEHYVLKRASS